MIKRYETRLHLIISSVSRSTEPLTFATFSARVSSSFRLSRPSTRAVSNSARRSFGSFLGGSFCSSPAKAI